MPKRSILFACLAVLAATLVAGPAGPAIAHDQLLASSPAEGERLETAPTEVTLRFGAEILTLGAVVLVVDAEGTDWAIGEPELNGPDVTVPLAPDMPDAGYEIRWRVVSSDGHPISDLIPFTIGDGEPYSSITAGNTDDEEQTAAVEEQATTEQSALLRIVLIGVGGAVIAVLVFIAISFIGRRRAAAPTNTKEHQ